MPRNTIASVELIITDIEYAAEVPVTHPEARDTIKTGTICQPATIRAIVDWPKSCDIQTLNLYLSELLEGHRVRLVRCDRMTSEQIRREAEKDAEILRMAKEIVVMGAGSLELVNASLELSTKRLQDVAEIRELKAQLEELRAMGEQLKGEDDDC